MKEWLTCDISRLTLVPNKLREVQPAEQIFGSHTAPLHAKERADKLMTAPLSARSLTALQNLAAYGVKQREMIRRANQKRDTLQPDTALWDKMDQFWPREKRAAVMVALFGGRSGELNVLLTTRSKDMRANVSAHLCG